TEEALETIRAYLSDPDADTFDLRLMTLIGRAKSYGRAWTHIEEGLQRLQKKVEEERDRGGWVSQFNSHSCSTLPATGHFAGRRRNRVGGIPQREGLILASMPLEKLTRIWRKPSSSPIIIADRIQLLACAMVSSRSDPVNWWVLLCSVCQREKKC